MATGAVEEAVKRDIAIVRASVWQGADPSIRSQDKIEEK